MSDVYEHFGVPKVINAAGKLTALGGTAQADDVVRAQAEAARWHVDLAELRRRAGEVVAERTGAEAASITSGAAAGVVVAVAACVAGSEPEHVARLPDSEGLPNRVLLQAGHDVNFGAPIQQMVRLGGGRPEVLGSAEGVVEPMLVDALREPAAALLFVQSHHAAQQGIVALDRCVALAHAAGVPVIVDAAAEEDLRRYIEAGADLVTYSGGKAFGGPTVGFVAGRRALVEACEAQNRGIARPMKVGKEQIIGLLVALERYGRDAEAAEQARRERVNATIRAALDGLDGVDVWLQPDEAGRPIERVAVRPRDGAFDARDLVAFLAGGSPSIRTRNHHLGDGIVLFDAREVTQEQAALIAERLRAFFARR
jgi:D-glucosaminate-6-phosphate ammonia-lyase